ncbi:hypothetical protein A7981_03820 [Methylovorus sp. MM2]|nr:hypothetical protein A7981_03820 [Methylovorus sp. MM2]
MEMIKAVIVAVTLSISMLIVPFSAYALSGDEQVEFTDALGTGNMKIVKKYFKNGVNVNDLYFAWSPLQIAANKGQLKVVQYLVEKGADVNYKHPITKMTAMHLAAVDGYEDVTKYLLAHGADLEMKLRGNVSILRAVTDTGNTKMVDLLVAAGATDDGCQAEKCN